MIWNTAVISHRSEVFAFQQNARTLVDVAQFGRERLAEFELALVELGTNLVKHAGGGRFIIRVKKTDRGHCLDLVALDTGPGMAHPERCLRDGVSTAGTLGGGLGAVRRLSDDFEIYTSPGRGTAVFVRFCPKKRGAGRRPERPRFPLPLDVDAVCVPRRGEEACGDGWAVEQRPRACDILVIDGLGHGVEAASVARRAVELFHRHAAKQTPAEMVHVLHDGLRGTRGGAAALVRIQPAAGRLELAGIGNIAARIVGADGSMQGIPSYYGIVGGNLLKVHPVEHPWLRERLLILHSDGLSERWRLSDYPGIFTHSPTMIAAVLFRDFWRERDDVTALVVKTAGP